MDERRNGAGLADRLAAYSASWWNARHAVCLSRWPLMFVLSIALPVAMAGGMVTAIDAERSSALRDRVQLVRSAYFETARQMEDDTRACAELLSHRFSAHSVSLSAASRVGRVCESFAPSGSWVVIGRVRDDGTHEHLFNGKLQADEMQILSAEDAAVQSTLPLIEQSRRLGIPVWSDPFYGPAVGSTVITTLQTLDVFKEIFVSIAIDPNVPMPDLGMATEEPFAFIGLVSPKGQIVARRPVASSLGQFLPDELFTQLSDPETKTLYSVPTVASNGPEMMDLAVTRVSPDFGWLIVTGQPSISALGYLRENQLFSAILLGDLAVMMAMILLVLRQRRTENELHITEGVAQAMQDADRRKTQLLQALSHELRGPLVRLIGAHELMQPFDDSASQRAMNAARSSAQSVLQLVDDLLDIAVLGGSSTSLSQSPVDIQELLGDVEAEFAATARERGLAFHVTWREKISPIMMDRLRLRQIAVNLLSNAFNATEEGAVWMSTDLRVCNQEHWLIITVSDTGVGMAPEFQARAFEEFTTRSEGGVGLGLSLVDRIVKRMNGNIVLESVEGQGTRFEIRLPVTLATDASADDLYIDEQSPLSGISLLLVEDDAVIRQSTVLRLHRAGAIVWEATDGAEAVALCRTRAFDVVLMDLEMPNMSGLDAARSIRSIVGDDSPIIFGLSSHVRSVKRDEALAAGMSELLTKPLQIQLFANILRAHSVGAVPSVIPSGHVDETCCLLLDHEVFDELLEIPFGEEFEDPIASFAAETRRLADQLSDTDSLAIRQKVHRFKGVAMVFGAVVLANALERLDSEVIEKGGDAEDVAGQVERVRSVLRRTITAMEQRKAELVSSGSA